MQLVVLYLPEMSIPLLAACVFANVPQYFEVMQALQCDFLSHNEGLLIP